MTDDNDDDAQRAAGIEATVGDQEQPKVSGVDPALAEKDPEDVSVADIAGLDGDKKEEVMQILQSDETTFSEDVGPSNEEPSNEPSLDWGDSQAEKEVTDQAQQDPSPEAPDRERDRDPDPEPATLDETGLLDENDEFPWEGESLGETSVGEGGVIERFRYKQTNFEVREPENRQRFERHFDSLAEAQEIDDRGKRRSTADRYSQKVAEQCLTVDGHPIDIVYRVEHNGSAYVVPDSDGSKGLAAHSSAEPLWDAMTWFDRFKLGMRLGEDVLGERQFRQRVS